MVSIFGRTFEVQGETNYLFHANFKLIIKTVVVAMVDGDFSTFYWILCSVTGMNENHMN